MSSIAIDRLDGLSSATAMKGPCRVATTANVTLEGEQTIDTVAVVEGDRVLVKDQTDATTNGIYSVNTGLWTRTKDFSRNRDIQKGTRVYVTDGSVGAGEYRVSSSNPVTVGSTNITFVRFGATDFEPYTAPPTGAVARPYVEKFAERISIMDFVPYSASSDIEIDTNAAANIIDFFDGGGKHLYLPARTFLLTAETSGFYSVPLVDVDGVSIVGEGRGVSWLKVADGLDRGPLAFTGCSKITLSGFGVDGNKANNTQTGVHGIRIEDAEDVVMFNLCSLNANGYGIGFQSSAGVETNIQRLVLSHSVIDGCIDDGLDIKNRLNANAQLIISDMIVKGHGASETGSAGLDIRGPFVLNNIHVNLSGSASGAGGIRLRPLDAGDNGEGGRHSSLSNFLVENDGVTSAFGLSLDDPDIQVSNGLCLGFDVTDGVGVHIHPTDADRISVSNVEAVGTNGGTAGYGFKIDSPNHKLINCCAVEHAVNFSINDGPSELNSCTAVDGVYGFRQTTGTGGNLLIGCRSIGHATAGYSSTASNVTSACEGFGTTGMQLRANNAIQALLTGTASAVNYLTVTGGATGEGPGIGVGGAEGGRPLRIGSRSGAIHFFTSGLTIDTSEAMRINHVSSLVNRLNVTPSATGNPVQVGAAGSDTNIDLQLTPKGSGVVRVGTHSALAAETVTGYITIKDAGGTTRKLAVVS